MKPHGRDCPDRCSLCIRAPARIVTVVGAELLVDGEPAGRELDPLATPGVRSYYSRRGGRAKARRTRP